MGAHPYGAQLRPQQQSKNLPRVNPPAEVSNPISIIWERKKTTRWVIFSFLVAEGGLVTAVGTLGKTYIVKDSDRFYYKDASVICFENFGKITPAYLKLLMYSPYMEDQIKQNSAGTTVGTITIVKANEYLIPLPPLMEQQRIVDQAERLQIHIDKL